MEAQIAVIDYGSQYSQLIVRRVRELGYFVKLYQPDDINTLNSVSAVILSGGPKSVSDKDALDIDLKLFKKLNIPILGICYGMQLLNVKYGGIVRSEEIKEYGPSRIQIRYRNKIFNNVPENLNVWMSHSDSIVRIGGNGYLLAVNEKGIPAAIKFEENIYGIQFHPEVSHTEHGSTILKNFLSLQANLKQFNMADYVSELQKEIQDKVRGRKVICAVSGGVDSTVLCVLLRKSGVRVIPVFIDTGLLRKNEKIEVIENFKLLGIEIKTFNYSSRFIKNLKNVQEPEEKREIIGNTFFDLFFEVAGEIEVLAQGTLYPDVIESATSGSVASRIKTHHNRVDKILKLKSEGRVIEPLCELFKDEVRKLGKELNIPDTILKRHPFPGPGLAVRILGCITEDKLKILREADYIFVRLLKETGWYDKIWQALCVLLDCKTVGIKGDERSYEYALSLRCVDSSDGMTADWSRIPLDILNRISKEILNNVKGINRILYDVSTKPPASIEWE
ncbi:MAG: glutamine-hydrolyzing GMP synthase [Candidatus Hydrogenedentota bacterium]